MSLRIAFLVSFFCLLALPVGAQSLAQKKGEPPAAGPVAEKSGSHPDKIPEAYIKEAEVIHGICKYSMAKMYDCECIAARFLDKRIAVGADIARTIIMMDIDDQCIDATGSIGDYYERCLDMPLLLPKGAAPEPFCKCYANAVTRIFNEKKVGQEFSTPIQTKALQECTAKGGAVKTSSETPNSVH